MTRSLRRHYKSCGKCRGNERLKRKVFRRLRKTDIEGADLTRWDRLFQVRAAATGKARSPTVDSRVRWTFSVSEEEERRRLRVPKSAVYSSLSASSLSLQLTDGSGSCKRRQAPTQSCESDDEYGKHYLITATGSIKITNLLVHHVLPSQHSMWQRCELPT